MPSLPPFTPLDWPVPYDAWKSESPEDAGFYRFDEDPEDEP